MNNDNIAGNTTEISDDDDDDDDNQDSSLNITRRKVPGSYRLNIVGVVQRQNKTKTNTTLSFTIYKFRVMDIVVRKIQFRPSKKSGDDDDDDDDEFSDDSIDDDNDDEYGFKKIHF